MIDVCVVVVVVLCVGLEVENGIKMKEMGHAGDRIRDLSHPKRESYH